MTQALSQFFTALFTMFSMVNNLASAGNRICRVADLHAQVYETEAEGKVQDKMKQIKKIK